MQPDLATMESGVQNDVYLFPCSVVQRTCWLLDRINPGSPSSNIAVRFLLRGDLQTARLAEAIREIVRRHEVLRTRFITQDGEPAALVESEPLVELPVIDLRWPSPSARKAEAERLAAEEACIGFDIEICPLFRAKLLRTADGDYTLLLTLHHIISDGWSIGIFTDELGEIYEALIEGRAHRLPPLEIQYCDYACWQKEWIESNGLSEQLEQLKNRLNGFRPLAIPTDFERPLISSAKGQIRSILLPKTLTASLKQFSDHRGCTLFVTMLSAFQLLMNRESGQADLSIRTQSSGRDRVELEPLIGWFVNSIILRADLSGDPNFSDLVEGNRQTVVDAFSRQGVPFETLMETIQPYQGDLRQPPFQVNFIFQRDFVRPWYKGGVSLTPIPSKSAGTFVDLNFFLVEREDGWRASVDVTIDVFDPETGLLFLQNYQRILEAIVANPRVRAREIDLAPRPLRNVLSPPNFNTKSFDNYVPPRNEYERAVIDIWENVLHLRSIGAYTNFFDLGGHSLNAATVLSQFRSRFGCDIKLAELFVDPTPAAMARVISGEEIYSDSREIIPVQPNGTRPPFFMIGGDHWFRPLARYIGLDQPFLGVPLLNYRNLDLGKERVTVAKEVARLIMSKYARMPFFLGGWCADGITAFEVARAIEQEGGEIGLTVLFDAMNPEYYREARALVHSAGRTITSLRDIVKTAVSDGLVSSASNLGHALGGVIKRVGKRVVETYSSDYSCGPVSFPVVVVRPPPAPLEEVDLGWSRACSGELRVIDVPGDHSAMFREPHVQELGKRLREQIDLALAEPSE